MRIGVYVGSFDPVHNGHEKIVNHLLNKNYLDKIIIIPTGNYWDKQNITKLNHREKMLKHDSVPGHAHKYKSPPGMASSSRPGRCCPESVSPGPT